MEKYINAIAKAMTKAETINALHALRAGHPLGCDNPYKYRNACALVSQAGFLDLRDVPHSAIAWLKKMADQEAS